jgi:hypothetical protein
LAGCDQGADALGGHQHDHLTLQRLQVGEMVGGGAGELELLKAPVGFRAGGGGALRIQRDALLGSQAGVVAAFMPAA